MYRAYLHLVLPKECGRIDCPEGLDWRTSGAREREWKRRNGKIILVIGGRTCGLSAWVLIRMGLL